MLTRKHYNHRKNWRENPASLKGQDNMTNKCSEDLKKARIYEAIKLQEIPKGQKPDFHVCAPTGWINDPNGFSVFKNEYHLFYQYHPYSTNWGPMHWGHSKTKDFIKWEQLPAALAPDELYDKAGCFSGSGIEHNGRHILMYTGVREMECEDGTHCCQQSQCIAVGDGINYEKMEHNPVIVSDDLPEGSSKEDFRDPKIWEKDGIFYSVIGSRNDDGSGQIALFTTVDFETWKFNGILDKCENRYGKMWECPDFFFLDGVHVLLASPQDMLAEGFEFHNGNGTICLIGNYDKNTCGFLRKEVQSIDYGLDFYAPQTLATDDGRRIMIGWMQSWDNHMTPEEFQWSGMMTIPRELHIKGGRLYQQPVKEIEKYYSGRLEYQHVSIGKRQILDGIEGRQVDLTVCIEAGDYEEFCISLAKDENFLTTVTYNAKKNVVTFDRNYAGICRDRIHSRSMYVNGQGGKIKLRILMDKYSVEIFVNDGAQAMTSLIYTRLSATGIEFSAVGKALVTIINYKIVIEE